MDKILVISVFIGLCILISGSGVLSDTPLSGKQIGIHADQRMGNPVITAHHVLSNDPIAKPGSFQISGSKLNPDLKKPDLLGNNCISCNQEQTESEGLDSKNQFVTVERYAAAQAEVDAINGYIKENNLPWNASVNPIMLLSGRAQDIVPLFHLVMKVQYIVSLKWYFLAQDIVTLN